MRSRRTLAPEPPLARIPHDVVVIGGGLCGLVVANRLVERGLVPVVLEAGPAPNVRLPARGAAFAAAVAPHTTIDADAWRFATPRRPLEWTRVRALGGRTLLWGGWMDRLDRAYLRRSSSAGAIWPAPPMLMRYQDAAERLLRVRTGRLEPMWRQAGATTGLPIAAKRCALHASGARALTALDLRRGITVRSHTVVIGIEIDRHGAVSGVEFVDALTGARGGLRARHVVLAASTYESCRILWASLRDGRERIGRGTTDQMSCGFALFHDAPAPPLATDPTVHPFKRSAVAVGLEAASGLGYTIEMKGPLPMAALPAADLALLGLSRREATRLSWSRIVAIGELGSHPGRRVTFDASRSDVFGRPLPVISVGPFGADERAVAGAMRRACLSIAGATGAFRVEQVVRPVPLGSWHEAGGAPMGADDGDAVCDLFGQVHGVSGLFVADAARLTRATDRHPSLTLAALALATADRLARGRGGRPKTAEK